MWLNQRYVGEGCRQPHVDLLTRQKEFLFDLLGKGDNGRAFCQSQHTLFIRQSEQLGARAHIFLHFSPHHEPPPLLGWLSLELYQSRVRLKRTKDARGSVHRVSARCSICSKQLKAPIACHRGADRILDEGGVGGTCRK